MFTFGSGEWLSEKLVEAEINVDVQKVSGNCSSTEKERVLEGFRTGWVSDIKRQKIYLEKSQFWTGTVEFYFRLMLRQWVCIFLDFALVSVSVHIFSQPFLKLVVFFPGIASTLWKLLQISGRLGRRVGENSIFITVAPKKHTMRGWAFDICLKF